MLPFAVHNGDAPVLVDHDVSSAVRFEMCYATSGCGASINFVSFCESCVGVLSLSDESCVPYDGPSEVHVVETGGNVAPCTKERRLHVKGLPVDFAVARCYACKVKRSDEHRIVVVCAPEGECSVGVRAE